MGDLPVRAVPYLDERLDGRVRDAVVVEAGDEVVGHLLVAADGVSFRGGDTRLLEALEMPVRLVEIPGLDDDDKRLRALIVKFPDGFEHFGEG